MNRFGLYRTITCLGLMLALITAQYSLAGTFRDDFEDGDFEGWKQEFPRSDPPEFWTIVDGELEGSKQGTDSSALITGQMTWTDYTIEFEVKLIEYHGEGDINILTRFTAPNPFQLVVFNIGDFCNPDGLCVTRVPPNGADSGKPFNPLELGKWYRVKLAVEDANFTLSIDDKEVLSYRDTAAKEGALGIGLTNYTARFDNIEITGPNVPDVTPPTWEPRTVEPRKSLTTTWGQIKIGK